MAKVVVLEPLGERAPREVGPTRPLADLTGARIGYLDNRKFNGDRLLHGIEAVLLREFQAQSLYRSKDSASIPAPPETLRELAAVSDAVLVALAD